MQELDDEERRHLALDDGHEENLVAVDAEEVVVRRGDHRRHVLRLRGPLLRLEEVVTDGAADDALPVLLQEDVPRGVDQEQAVDHDCGGAGRTTGPSRSGSRSAAPHSAGAASQRQPTRSATSPTPPARGLAAPKTLSTPRLSDRGGGGERFGIKHSDWVTH